MNKLTVYEVWSGTPMKMHKRYAWKISINMVEYTGEIQSTCTYDSPEAAMEDYQKICGCDEVLHSIPVQK